MKDWLVFGVGLIISVVCLGQSISSISVTPTNPTSNDPISVVVTTSMPTSSCWLTTSTISSSGNSHDIFGAHCAGIAQTTCTSTDTFYLGILSPGTHFVDYTMYSGSLSGSQTQCTSFQYGDTMSYSFFVSNSGGSLPVEIHPQGDHDICEGDSFFFHTDGVQGQTFNWIFNGQLISGATGTSHWAIDSGFYQVRVYVNGDSGTSAAQLLHVHDRPGGPLTLDEDIITVNANAIQHQWYEVQSGMISGADSHWVQVSQDGSYYVDMVNSFQCQAYSDTLYVEFIDAEIDPTGAVNICESDSVVLQATPSGLEYDYTWIKNGVPIPFADSSFYAPSTSGEYKVRISISQSFDTSAVTDLELIPSPNPLIVLNDTTIESVMQWASYQWYSFGGGIIAGATSNNYIPASNGIYYLSVIDSVGCTGISNSITIESVGLLEQRLLDEIQVYSTGGEILLRFANGFSGSVMLTDLAGKLVTQDRFSGSLYRIETEGISSGYYLLTVQDQDGETASKKVYVQ